MKSDNGFTQMGSREMGRTLELRRRTENISRAGDRREAKENIRNAYHLPKPHE